MNSDSVVIIVVPRDRFSMFSPCLEAIYAHTDVPFQVVIAAGGVDVATKQYLHQCQLDKKNLRFVLHEKLLMQGEARNLAMQYVQERFCVILENDTIVHQKWIQPLLKCMREEHAAAVMPLIRWYRGIHAAGCSFDERRENGNITFRHKILYTDIYRKKIDYPECHCILIDRDQMRGQNIFDDVEPFDVDLGLILRKHGLSAFLEPRSIATYSAPPPLEVRDIPAYKFRWDGPSWVARNERFMQKWGVTYDPSVKRASYQRQQFKLGLARWYPTRITVGMSNIGARLMNRILASTRGHSEQV